MSLNDKFIGALKMHMTRRNLSAFRLARLTGLNPSTVQRIINGDVSPTLETVGKITKELKFSF